MCPGPHFTSCHIQLITFCSPSQTDTNPTCPSTPPQSPSLITKHTPTTQPNLPSDLTSPSGTALHAKVDLGQTLNSSHPSDCPPQVTAPLPASAASVSLAQPHPQSQPQHLSSNKGSRVPSGPVQASDETLQQQPLPNPISAIPSGSVWRM